MNLAIRHAWVIGLAVLLAALFVFTRIIQPDYGADGFGSLVRAALPFVFAVAGQTVVVKYTGWLWDGTQFDSSWDADRVYPVANVGQAQVIAGWNQGLVGLTVGSQALLVIPPDLGYGSTASGPIPADSTLVFVVDVLAVG